MMNPGLMEPLEDIVVLELGGFITAPYAGLLLADLGADVIKIERPEGDPFRAFRGGSYSPNFVGFNRNKRSACVDMGTAAGRETFARMATQADVVIENFRPGVMERMGLSSQTLLQANPRLVYCAIAGFPPGSPQAQSPAFDLIGQALGGMMHTFLDPESPEVRGPTVADQLAGMYACYGILGALAARAKTGLGRRVDVNMVESAISFMPDFHASYTREGTVMQSTTRASYSHSFAFRCADGELVGIQLSSPEKFWLAFIDAIEMPALGTDTRFRTRMDRIRNFDALRQELAPRFLAKPLAHWLDVLVRADVPHAPVRTVAQVHDDPALAAAGTFHTVRHPEMGDVSCIARPVFYDHARPVTRHAPPVLGEHTESVLRQFGCEVPDKAAPANEG